MLLAQLTDTHMKPSGRRAYGHVDTAAFLRAAVTQLNALRPKVDAVIVTGDIADSGQREEYAVFRALIAGLEAPWFVVPGNHDDRRHFLSAFADRSYLTAGSAFVQYAVDDFPFRLVGLDTSEPGRAEGRMCRERLEWLDACLSQRPSTPTLVFQHHPPFETGIRHMDVQNLRDGESLVNVLARHPQVRHVACGHVHRAVETALAGIGVSIAPSPAHAVTFALDPAAPPSFTLEPPTLRLFRLDAVTGVVVSHLLPVGDFPGPYPFFGPDGSILK